MGDPYGIYLHATAPPLLTFSVATALGPYFILVILFVLLCGANLSLYGLYLHLFASRAGGGGDPLLLHFAVFLSVSSNIVLAFYGFIRYYQCDFIELYSNPGYDINRIEPYVVFFHVFQGVAVAIGQVYFLVRIAKLFELKRKLVRGVIGVALVAIVVQFGLIVAFGVAFYSVGYKSHLLDPQKRLWVKEIIAAWTLVFISLELSMTVTTIVRLVHLRSKTTMDAARRVLFNLAVYSVQGQAMLTVFSLSSLLLFSRSETGWYTPMYLLSGSLYTLVLLANLCYRSVVRRRMREASECGSVDTKGLGGFDLAAVKTYRTQDEGVQELPMDAVTTVRVVDWDAEADAPARRQCGSIRSWQDVAESSLTDSVSSGVSRHRRSHTTPVLPLVRVSSKTSFRSFSDRFPGVTRAEQYL